MDFQDKKSYNKIEGKKALAAESCVLERGGLFL